MLRLPAPSLSTAIHRLFSSSVRFSNGTSYDSTPGWHGRTLDDHVVHRKDELDVQSKASQSGMKQQEKGQKGSQGLSRKDEGDFNKRAKEDHPEAPGPVLGMNDERGSKGH